MPPQTAGRTGVGPRILVARPDHLGDVLLTLPAAVALRRALPAARISYLVAPSTADAPRHCPAVDETLTLPFPPPSAPASPPGWPETVERAAAALRGRFDAAILPRIDDPWSGAVVAAAEIPLRVGFDVPATRPFLTNTAPLAARRHVADLAVALVRIAVHRLGGSDADPAAPPLRSCFVPTPADDDEATTVLAGAGAGPGSDLLVLHPGSGWPIKNWPPSRWGALAAALHRRDEAAPLVVGSAREQELVEAVVRASGGAARGLAGQLSLGALAALHRRARLVIATDSGPLHLAALVGAPVVGLYGPADPLQFGPLCPPERGRVVRVPLPCSPCRSLEDPPCGIRHLPPCVDRLSVDAVLAAVRDLLGDGPAARGLQQCAHQPAAEQPPWHPRIALDRGTSPVPSQPAR